MSELINNASIASSGFELPTGFGLSLLIVLGVFAIFSLVKWILDRDNSNDSLFNFESRMNRYKKVGSTSFKKNKYKNYVGVEIECIRAGKNVSRESLNQCNFSSGTDASVNDSEGDGKEYRSNPSNGDKALKMIRDFSKELINTGHKVDESCGLHIHIETLPDLDLLKKLYCFYSKYEGLFFAMLPKSRQESEYCKKFKRVDKYDYEDVLEVKDLESFKKLYYDTDFEHFPTGDHGHRKRYCWINFHSIFYRGTLEIRGHSGTINGNKINNWILMHLAVREYLDNNSIEDIVKMPVTKTAFLKIFSNDLKQYIKERWKLFPDIAEENFKEYK